MKLNDLNIADYLPNLKTAGAAKAPGRAPKDGSHPRPGASHFDPRITIVSNPPKPDNSLLTLKNETVPPSPKPPVELQVPDVISGGPKPTPEAAKSPTPAPEKVNTPAPPVAPPVEPPPPPEPPKPMKDPALEPPVTPHVSLTVSLPPPPVQFAAKLPDLPAPNLEVPLPPPPPKPAPPAAPPASAPSQPAEAAQPATKGTADSQAGGGKATPATASGEPSPGGGPQIMSLSVNPIPLKDLASIPGGIHNGEFSISPAGTMRGSPGGTPGGSPEVGEGGPGAGGDKSSGVGNGKGKPGGGGQGNPSTSPTAGPSVSITGPPGAAGISSGTLPPLKPADLVYPVKPDTPKAHAPTMVVSSGSFGGGGLRVFGVLHGGKIYTIYYPMPGKSWILQYCAQEKPLQQNPNTRMVTIQMSPPLTPPAVIDQFDFHRPPRDPGAANSMIILHGSIKEDGSVSGLSVVQGLDSISNDAATIAFSRWKFKPAQISGAPVAVEILIGIP